MGPVVYAYLRRKQGGRICLLYRRYFPHTGVPHPHRRIDFFIFSRPEADGQKAHPARHHGGREGYNM